MSFFDTVVNKAKEGAAVAGQKAGVAVELSKLSISVAEKKGTIEKIYSEMGKIVYDGYKSKDASTDMLNEKCTYIDQLMDEIAELKKRINVLKKIKVCTNCGEENPNENEFCAKCGAKLPDAPAENIVVEDFTVNESAGEEKPEV